MLKAARSTVAEPVACNKLAQWNEEYPPKIQNKSRA
jgi:hypothetical protein